jgi:hypothetical protein
MSRLICQMGIKSGHRRSERSKGVKMKKLLIVLSTVLLVVSLTFAGCNSTPAGPSNGEEPPPTGVPKPGEWTVETFSNELYDLTFTVSPDSTGITKITFSTRGFECGGSSWSPGQVSVSNPSPWPIISDQFNIEVKVGEGGIGEKDLYLDILGWFSGTEYAYGIWEISALWIPCSSGGWEAWAP